MGGDGDAFQVETASTPLALVGGPWVSGITRAGGAAKSMSPGSRMIGSAGCILNGGWRWAFGTRRMVTSFSASKTRPSVRVNWATTRNRLLEGHFFQGRTT